MSSHGADSTPPRRGPLDARLRTAITAVAGVGGAFTLIALPFFGVRTALSVAVGACIATGNLWVLARIIAALLPAETDDAEAQNRAGWTLVALLKLFGLVAVVWLLMRQGVVSPIAMLVGFGALPIGIAIGSLVSDRSAPSE